MSYSLSLYPPVLAPYTQLTYFYDKEILSVSNFHTDFNNSIELTLTFKKEDFTADKVYKADGSISYVNFNNKYFGVFSLGENSESFFVVAESIKETDKGIYEVNFKGAAEYFEEIILYNNFNNSLNYSKYFNGKDNEKGNILISAKNNVSLFYNVLMLAQYNYRRLIPDTVMPVMGSVIFIPYAFLYLFNTDAIIEYMENDNSVDNKTYNINSFEGSSLGDVIDEIRNDGLGLPLFKIEPVVETIYATFMLNIYPPAEVGDFCIMKPVFVSPDNQIVELEASNYYSLEFDNVNKTSRHYNVETYEIGEDNKVVYKPGNNNAAYSFFDVDEDKKINNKNSEGIDSLTDSFSSFSTKYYPDKDEHLRLFTRVSMVDESGNELFNGIISELDINGDVITYTVNNTSHGDDLTLRSSKVQHYLFDNIADNNFREKKNSFTFDATTSTGYL